MQKIETVGQTYMAATGIIDCEVGMAEKLKKQDKCVRLVNMAFQMITIAESQTWANGEKRFKLKIGINKVPTSPASRRALAAHFPLTLPSRSSLSILRAAPCDLCCAASRLFPRPITQLRTPPPSLDFHSHREKS